MTSRVMTAEILARVLGERKAAHGQFTLPPIEIPTTIAALVAHCKPLIYSSWSWAYTMRALIARKSYGGSEGPS